MQEVATTCSHFFNFIAFTKHLFHFCTTFNSLLDFIKDTTHPHTKSVVQLMMRRGGRGKGGEGLWIQCGLRYDIFS
jgi:hypothetical protein